MCFAIPKKIRKVSGGFALTEDGKRVKTGNLKLTSSDFVRVYGNMVVEKIDKKEAMKIRRLIRVNMS